MAQDVQHVSTITFPIAVATWGTFFIVALISFYFQLRAGNQKLSFASLLEHLFPREGWSKKSTKIDVFMYFMRKVIDRLFPITFFLLTFEISQFICFLLYKAIPSHQAVEIGIIGVIVCALIVFLAVDLANYVSHAWEHYVPALWELHKVHHSATFLQPTTTSRMHPLEPIFDGFVAAIFKSFPIGCFLFTYDLTFVDTLILVANANLIGTIAVLDVIRHSHFPISFGALDSLVLSPHMHQAHHSVAVRHWDRNFGNKLSLWDWLFGTAVKPAPGETFVYGLGTKEDAAFESIFGVYIRPLVTMGHVLREKKLRGLMMRQGARFFRTRRKATSPVRQNRQPLWLARARSTPSDVWGRRPWLRRAAAPGHREQAEPSRVPF